MKRYFTNCIAALAALLVISTASAAEQVTFTVDAPMMVAVGETFRVEFLFNAKPEDNSFSPPQFEGFDILAGPALSQGSSIQIINGSMNKSVSYTYTYVLTANEEGNRTIPTATIKHDGKRYSTRPLPIEVVKEQQIAAKSGTASGGGEQSAGASIAKDDILIRMILSRDRLFKGEALRATIKLYYRAPIVAAENEKMPTFQGFWAQQIGNNTRGVTARESYNGKVYETQTLRDYMLYPQQSGEITIEPVEMDLIAQVILQSRNIDPFFGGGHERYNVRRHVSTPKITVNVEPLPAGAPASFAGAVGSFAMDVTAPEQSILANSSSSYRIRISGTGNLSFVQAPELNLPNSFESYSVKSTESINTTERGASGYKEFEYPFIARSEGDYSIPAIEFSYFDPSSMSYKTLSSKTATIVVKHDASDAGQSPRGVQMANPSLTKEEVKLLGEDIRFIKIGTPALTSSAAPLIFSPIYFASLAAIIIIAISLYLYLLRRKRERGNIATMRGKRASKMAVQRLRKAKAYISEGNERAFYEEMLRALWGYMGDKLNIPVADLTKESIREQLNRRNVAAEAIERFSSLIERCNEAQYSPMASSQMSEIYSAGLDIISQIESMIKK